MFPTVVLFLCLFLFVFNLFILFLVFVNDMYNHMMKSFLDSSRCCVGVVDCFFFAPWREKNFGGVSATLTECLDDLGWPSGDFFTTRDLSLWVDCHFCTTCDLGLLTFVRPATTGLGRGRGTTDASRTRLRLVIFSWTRCKICFAQCT